MRQSDYELASGMLSYPQALLSEFLELFQCFGPCTRISVRQPSLRMENSETYVITKSNPPPNPCTCEREREKKKGPRNMS